MWDNRLLKMTQHRSWWERVGKDTDNAWAYYVEKYNFKNREVGRISMFKMGFKMDGLEKLSDRTG